MSRSKFAWGQSTNRSHLTKFSTVRWLLLGLLLGLLMIGAIPGYFRGQWNWAQLPKIENIQYLKNVRETGLKIPNYQQTAQQQFTLGNQQWSVQILNKQEHPPFLLFLMPQDYYKNMPQTEWSDLQYLEKWKIDAPQMLQVPIQFQSLSYSVMARYFRAWTQTTFIIVQWYAWPGGGNVAPSRWFWTDQSKQLRRQRVPWIAVLLKIPIEPTQELRTKLPDLKMLVQDVQTALETKVFSQLNQSTPAK